MGAVIGGGEGKILRAEGKFGFSGRNSSGDTSLAANSSPDFAGFCDGRDNTRITAAMRNKWNAMERTKNRFKFNARISRKT